MCKEVGFLLVWKFPNPSSRIKWEFDLFPSISTTPLHSPQPMGNLKNVVIAFLVPLPSIAFYLSFLHHSHQENQSPSHAPPFHFLKWCSHHPLLLANLLFFFNVNVLFWVIGLIQSNHWLIDLYWTVIPVMLVHYYASHPMARSDVVRSTVVIVLTWVWSIRLTHNYFRREKWRWGAREDWRFNDMRKEYGKNWWWISFFAVYVSQQVSWPISLHSRTPWGPSL